MRGSHAASLRTIVSRTLRDELRLERGARILCACSGGPDSTAMLHVLASLRKVHDFELAAHGVDHGLRPEASAELELARAVAEKAGIEFSVAQLQVPPGSNLQARAREARYVSLWAAARTTGSQFVATAHTFDDRAETVLMRLLRGTGARGLAVLPARDGSLLRPLIRASRAAVLLHTQRNALLSAADPSNLDTRYARVRVRREILPYLRGIAPNIEATLVALADELAEVRGEAPPNPGLGRLGLRQRQQLRSAILRGKPGRVRIDDCKEVLAEWSGTSLVITEAESAVSGRRRRRGPEK